MDINFDDDLEQFSIPLSRRVTPPEPLIKIQFTWSCPICLDGVADDADQQFCATKCGHLFCHKCLQSALEVSPQCPICKGLVSGKKGTFDVKLIESVIGNKTGIKVITKCGHLFGETKPVDKCPTCGIVVKRGTKVVDIFM